MRQKRPPRALAAEDSTRSGCPTKTQAGKACRAAQGPDGFCRWHSPDPAAQAKHREESQRGGQAKAYGSLASVAPLADDERIAALDLETATGLRGLLAYALGALTRLPFSERTGNTCAQLVIAQQSMLKTTDYEQRLAALERAVTERPTLRRTG